MLSDDDLVRLLTEAAESFPVPADVTLDAAEAEPTRPWRRRAVQLVAVAAALVAGVLLVQGMGDGGLTNKTDMTTAGEAVPGSALAPSGDLGGGTTGGSTGGTTGTTGTAWTGSAYESDSSASQLGSQPAPAVAAPVAPGAAAARPPATQTDTPDARVVKTGSLSVIVDDGRVPATVTKVTQVAKAARGSVSDSTTHELGDNPSATVTLKVPVASFDTVVDQLRALKAEVVSQESTAKDVSSTYTDVEAQIASLRAARARFLTILSGARTIGETLTVQQRVDDVQARIDRLEAQRRLLADQTELATLTVTIGEEADAVLRTSEQSGLGKAWDDAKDGFTGGVEGLIARSGRALLVLIVAAVAFAVLRFGWRLARRRLV